MRTLLIFFCRWLGLCICLFGTNAVAAQSDFLLKGYFRDLDSLRADFVQRVFDEQNRLLQTSSGRVYMEKPGRFRWDYQEPYRQVVVADGDRLWLYDTELEQVTVRRLDTALSATPLALLSGAAPLDEAFVVSPITSGKNGFQWYELLPRNEQAEFNVLRVAFEDGVLHTIELEDLFSQRTRLDFQNLEPNVAIDPELLRFVPPPQVDVVGDVP